MAMNCTGVLYFPITISVLEGIALAPKSRHANKNQDYNQINSFHISHVSPVIRTERT